MNNEAASFKNTLVDEISKYLDIYLEEKLPTASVNEAVQNKKAISLLENLRQVLSVDMALAKDNIREAVVDGKTRLDEAASQLEAATKEVARLADENKKLSAKAMLEEKVSDLDQAKKTYMKKMLNGKSAEFIKENFDYTLKLFEKTEEERLKALKTEAVSETVSAQVDRPVIEEAVQPQEVNETDPMFNTYMGELSKY